MGEILLSKNEVEYFIKENILEYSLTDENDIDACYHHNSRYIDILSILKYGILSLKKMNELGIRHLSDEQLVLFDDITSHINGVNGISLSVRNMKDLYKNEEEYMSDSEELVDFTIDSNIKAVRNSSRYGNEYISYDDISVDSIRTLDFRIINLLNNSKIKDDKFYKKIAFNYNRILEAAKIIKLQQNNIAIRETSNNTKKLEIDKIVELPRIRIN